MLARRGLCSCVAARPAVATRALSTPANLSLADEPAAKAKNSFSIRTFEPVDLLDPATYDVKVLSLSDASSPGGQIKLDESIFGMEPRRDILQRVVRWQLANRRTGNHKAKTRSEVSGTTKKPFRQKGNGTARQGTLRGPHQRGGGAAFGPVVRDHSHKLPKKVRKLGLKCALSAKLTEGKLVVIDNVKLDSPKTKDLAVLLEQHGLESACVIDGEELDLKFEIASKNLPNIKGLPYTVSNHTLHAFVVDGRILVKQTYH
jgi:large subunit ribosomal protein L4